MADFQAYFSFFLILLIITILIRTFLKSTSINSRLPPTPFALPIIGHLHLVTPIPHRAFHKLSLRYGPIYRLLLGSKPCVVVCSPDTVKEFLKTHENAYLNRPQNAASSYMTYETNDFSFVPYGPHWKFMKKIVVSRLLNGTTLASLGSVRHDEINCFIKSLSKHAKLGEAVDVGAKLMTLTNNVISRMLMSKRFSYEDGEADEASKLVADITKMSGNFNLSDYIWFLKAIDLQGFGKNLKDTRGRFDVMIEKIIKEHEEAIIYNGRTGEVKDLLDILLDIAKDETMEIKLSRVNIKAFLMNIFTAATDTSAGTLEWALAELINHPYIMKKALQEIHQVVGKNRLLQESDIPNLPYLQAIVKETLRLYPSIPVIPRQSTQDCMVAGYHIPTNTGIFINLWALGRDPNYWENPLEFRPERFENNELDVRGQNFHMLPFGSGRRMCPGVSLALLMVPTTLGTMIQCFEWKAGKNGDLTSVDMDEAFGLTLPRANPLVCVPVSRLDHLDG